MCDTNLKFGPEWLRALTEPQTRNSEEKVAYSPVLANMKLAEFRYGKEEMLALFNSELEPPSDIISIGALYVDSCQFPLNLIQMGAEEAKAWQKNSDTSSGGRGFSAPRASSSLSRGRGRGRATSFPHFDRNRFDDPDSDTSSGHTNGSKLGKGEKGWSDSKGKPNSDSVSFSDSMRDWRDRKGGVGTGTGGMNDKVWSGNKGLVNGHANTNMNWRSHERNGNSDDLTTPKPRSDDWSSLGGSIHAPPKKDKVNLPEWVTTNSNNIAEGGFDDNGKFRADQMAPLDNLPKWTNDEKWIEEEVEPEIISPSSQPPNSLPTNRKVPQLPPHSLNQQLAPPQESNQVNNNNLPKLSENPTTPPVASTQTATVPMPGTTAASHSGTSNEPSYENIKWSYLDPQGQVQGPFRHDEMLEWSTAGYFPNDLLIKRNIDGRFIHLTDMLRLYGKNPFTSGPIPRPINVDANEHISQQQYLQHLLLQQQLLAQQQQILLLQHPQSTNLNNLLMNKTMNPSIIKPNDPLVPSPEILERKQEDMMAMQNQRSNPFDLSPKAPAPSFDPIKSLLSQLQESASKAEAREASVQPVSAPLTSGHTVTSQLTSGQAVTSHMTSTQTLTSQLSDDFNGKIQNESKSIIIPEQPPQPEMKPVDIPVKQTHVPSGMKQQEPLHQQLSQKQQQVFQQIQAQHQQQAHQQKLQLQEQMSSQVDQLVNDEDAGQDDAKSEKMSEASSEPIFVPPTEELEPEAIDDLDFKIPRSTEKKEKTKRKAEIKKKAKSNKETKPSAPYIPGLPETQGGSVAGGSSPVVTEEEKAGSQEREVETRKRSETTPPDDIKGESQTKPAPWANCKSPENKQLSLHDIQKLEAEKERKKKAERIIVETQIREKKEMEIKKTEKQQVTWSHQLANNNVKSLAEIQAEEEKNIRHEQQKEIKSRKVHQKAPEKVTSWAGKIAASIPVAHSSPAAIQSKTRVAAPTDGFWEHGTSTQVPSTPASQPANKNNKADKKSNKNGKKDGKNEICKAFKDWCRTSLENLNTGPDLDIETFLGFLQDIESPYEVNDYIKSYIGDSKAHKKFAADYLDKRSHLKNALKKNNPTEDDLTSPATALAHDLEFQEAPRKGKKKTRNSKTNLNHLLGFTTAPGSGINRGELDLPM